LKKFFTPDHYFDDLDSINGEFFKKNNIKIIFCDIDNTLVRYSERSVTDYSARFLKRAASEGIKVVLLSNNTDESRGKMFHQKDRVISFPNAKKPMFSKKLITNMLKKFGIEKKNALVVGDQIFTDVLAGRFCNVKTLLVDPLGPSMLPFFEVKRFFEKPIKRNFIKKYGKNV